MFALLAAACSQAAQPETTHSSAYSSREPNAAAEAALDRAGRRPPSELRRATKEEVKARFERIERAREAALTNAAQPENLDELLTRLASSTHRTERSVLIHRYLAAANAMNAAERPAVIARLQAVVDATSSSSASR